MAILAVWFQETDAISSGNSKLLMIFIGLVAVSMFVLAIASIVIAVKATKAMKQLSATAEEFKSKALPLIDAAMDMGHTAHQLLNDTAPKVRIITDNLVETSVVVRHSAQEFDRTVADANMRTQRQVARVDGMVAAALNTTAEVVQTIHNGIRVPVQKVVGMANQAKSMLEGMLARVRKTASGSPFNR